MEPPRRRALWGPLALLTVLLTPARGQDACDALFASAFLDRPQRAFEVCDLETLEPARLARLERALVDIRTLCGEPDPRLPRWDRRGPGEEARGSAGVPSPDPDYFVGLHVSLDAAMRPRRARILADAHGVDLDHTLWRAPGHGPPPEEWRRPDQRTLDAAEEAALEHLRRGEPGAALGEVDRDVLAALGREEGMRVLARKARRGHSPEDKAFARSLGRDRMCQLEAEEYLDRLAPHLVRLDHEAWLRERSGIDRVARSLPALGQGSPP